MISVILFIWIGLQLNAPAWYYVLLTIMCCAKIISMLIK